MIQYSNNINLVDYNRRKELIERSIFLSKIAEKYRSHTTWSSGIEWKISKVKSYYWMKYREQLSLEELTILNLYVIIPNDYDLINFLNKYNNNLKKVAQIYGVDTNIIKLRYENMLFMEFNKFTHLEEHKSMDQHKKMYEHKNMDEHKDMNEHKTLKLTI